MKNRILFIAFALLLALSAGACAEPQTPNEDMFALLGVVQHMDDVSMDVLEGNGTIFTLFFTGEFPSCAVPEGLGEGDAVRAVFYGGVDESLRGDLCMLTDVVNDMTATVAGIDGEAITVTDSSQTVFTFFFDEFYPRTSIPESLEPGSAVRVLSSGGFDENNQFVGKLFALYEA